jgi:valine dehydrogenase (NAD+)
MGSMRLAYEHEEVGSLWHRESGLHAIVAIHSTALGPALGGTRFRNYASFDEAMTDVLRLSEAMSYKASLAGLDLGGGKAVIIGDPATRKTEALLTRYAAFLDDFGGRYLTAEDVGVTQTDMDFLGGFTPFVTGRSVELGGSGDPSPLTAYGVVCAMEAAAEALWGSASLEGRHVAVSGVGKVGSELARLCAERGARLTVADVSPAAVRAVTDALPAAVVDPASIHRVECDLYAPCALGSALREVTAGELRCSVVCGAANNQLADASIEGLLSASGIVYVPDYLVNAGGIINIAYERGGYDPVAAREHVGRIFETTRALFAEAEQTGMALSVLADKRAKARIDAASGPARPAT